MIINAGIQKIQTEVEETTDSAPTSGLPVTPASQIGTILTLYLILRITILLFYTQQGLFNAYIDYHYYYRTAQLSEQGYLPFVNMWYEYPPILAYLPQIAYWLAGRIIPLEGVDSLGYQVFVRVLGLMLLVFDAGVLLLIYDIGKRLWGMEKANWLGWVYASLSLPLFFWSFAHQGVAVFFLLLSLWWFIRDRHYASAAALGLGIASKITPVFLLAPAVRFLWPQRKRLFFYLILVLLTVTLVYLPFVLMGGSSWIAASFAALSRVGSYGTVWAILDGNWGPGTYGELSSRLEIGQAYQMHANPATIPGFVVLLAFGVLYGLYFFRPLRGVGKQEFIWFTTLTALVFHLWSRGWSPHWAMILIPLFLLSFPDRRGLGWTLALTGLVFIEWPFTVALGLKGLVAVFILMRVALFIFISFRVIQQLWPARRDKIPSNV